MHYHEWLKEFPTSPAEAVALMAKLSDPVHEHSPHRFVCLLAEATFPLAGKEGLVNKRALTFEAEYSNNMSGPLWTLHACVYEYLPPAGLLFITNTVTPLNDRTIAMARKADVLGISHKVIEPTYSKPRFEAICENYEDFVRNAQDSIAGAVFNAAGADAPADVGWTPNPVAHEHWYKSRNDRFVAYSPDGEKEYSCHVPRYAAKSLAELPLIWDATGAIHSWQCDEISMAIASQISAAFAKIAKRQQYEAERSEVERFFNTLPDDEKEEECTTESSDSTCTPPSV